MQWRVEGAPQSFYRDLGRLLLQRVHQRVLGRRTDNFTFRRVQHARSAFAAGSLSGALFRHLNVDRGLHSSSRPGSAFRWGWRRSADSLHRLGQVESFHVGEFIAQLGEGAHLLARAGVHLACTHHFQHLAQIFDDLLKRLGSAQVKQDATLRGVGVNAGTGQSIRRWWIFKWERKRGNVWHSPELRGLHCWWFESLVPHWASLNRMCRNWYPLRWSMTCDWVLCCLPSLRRPGYWERRTTFRSRSSSRNWQAVFELLRLRRIY